MTAAQRLLHWYDRNGRRLPWRNTRDPYRILISEIMLQQTQVPRVLLFYKKWLKRFPSWKTLARASNADVINAWAGLGYNRRALMLRDIAKHVTEHGTPKTEQAWRERKGIGPYTAAALAAFSLHERTLPIDTNIRRVLARFLLGVPFPDPKLDERLKSKAERFLPTTGRFYDVPQALFDLATSVCTKSTACAACPMRSLCKAAPKFLSGDVRTPKRMIPKAMETRHRNKPFPDRIYRGRILRCVRESTRPVDIRSLGLMIDKTFDARYDMAWLKDMINRLKKEGFIQQHGRSLSLVETTEGGQDEHGRQTDRRRARR